MSASNELEAQTSHPMIAFESDFVDYQETQKLCPTREANADPGHTKVDAEIRQVAAALSLLDLCGSDPQKARKAIEIAMQVRDGSIRQLPVAVGAVWRDVMPDSAQPPEGASGVSDIATK